MGGFAMPEWRARGLRRRRRLAGGARLGAGMGEHPFDVSRTDPLATRGARQLGVDDLPAVSMAEQDGGLVGVVHPAVPPPQERHDDRVEVAALLGQSVLVALGMLGVLAALEHAVLDERLKTLGEDRPRCPGAGLE